MTDAEIDALADPARWTQVFDQSTIAALQLTDALCGSGTNALDPELQVAIRSGFSEAERAELILVIGQANLNNRAGNAAKQLLGEGGG